MTATKVATVRREGRTFAQQDVPREVRAVGEARRWARDQITRTIYGAVSVPPAVLDTLILCLSEILTNAVRHGVEGARISVTLTLLWRPSHPRRTRRARRTGRARLLRRTWWLRVEVIEDYPDETRAPLQPLTAGDLDNWTEDGRGLGIVAVTTAAWGDLPTATGRVVWFEVAFT